MKKTIFRLLVIPFVTIVGITTDVATAANSDFVVPVSGGNLIRMNAHVFDLDGKTIRLQPSPGGYSASALALNFDQATGTQLDPASGSPERFGAGTSWSRSLPFAFPFAGTAWNSLFINLHGNVSF